jgi:hypothetical protein
MKVLVNFNILSNNHIKIFNLKSYIILLKQPIPKAAYLRA